MITEKTQQSLAVSEVKSAKSLKVLAYVHLRNIHDSTGAGRTARQIVEHLAAKEDVSLKVLADAEDQKRILPLVQEPWTSYDYRLFKRDTTLQQAQWLLLDAPKAESYWPESDIIFCTGESYVPTKQARLVITAHDAGYFEQGSHIRDRHFWQTRLKWEILYKKLSSRADMFHTVSQFSAERLAHFFPRIKSRIRWVHNGVTPHFYGPVSAGGAAFVQSVGLSNCPFVLVPGGLHFRKNAELILEAAPQLLQRFPDLVIAVVNHTNPVYAERARRYEPRIRLLGFVSDEALQALYTSATVVWYPSRYEGFGLPVVEAMACGASVVASNSSSIPEIAGDAATLVDPHSVSAHVDAISSLMTDPLARTQFAEVGRARAARFTWAACADKLKRDFDSLL